jgi:uncharacterized protein YidB (DUF937 family)
MINKQDEIQINNDNSDSRGSDGEGVLVERLASGGLGAARIAWLTTRWFLLVSAVTLFTFFGGLWQV